jgi:hypothetical protein
VDGKVRSGALRKVTSNCGIYLTKQDFDTLEKAFCVGGDHIDYSKLTEQLGLESP